MTSGRAAESLTQRIRNLASSQRIAPIRLRNRIAFQRMLARLAQDPSWVLKGGFSLEVRLGLSSRATKDLDLLRLGAAPATATDLQDALDEALEQDLRDGFAFSVRVPKPVRLEEAEPSTWRVVVDVRFDGAEFGSVTIDVVPRPLDSGADTELLRIEPTIVGEPFSVLAIDVHRHLAEKFHAYSRVYAHDRPSSRVKDLIDIVLLADSGLVVPQALTRALHRVFAERDTPLPDPLPQPPGDWIRTYAALAVETGTDVREVHAAWTIADDLYHRALAQKDTE